MPNIKQQEKRVRTAARERLENLRKLEDLHEAGVLTDEEFRAKRATLLGERQ